MILPAFETRSEWGANNPKTTIGRFLFKRFRRAVTRARNIAFGKCLPAGRSLALREFHATGRAPKAAPGRPLSNSRPSRGRPVSTSVRIASVKRENPTSHTPVGHSGSAMTRLSRGLGQARIQHERLQGQVRHGTPILKLLGLMDKLLAGLVQPVWSGASPPVILP